MTAMLEGLQVLVTRPAAQAGNLCELFEKAGADSHALAVMDIQPLHDTESLMRLRHVTAWDMLIFVSRNAVEYALPYLAGAKLPKVVAIGQKTAGFAAKRDIRVDIVPPEFNSESLLNMYVMQSVAGKRILIIRGQGGRETLAEVLRQRGASVDYAEVYKRLKPMHNAPRLQRLLREDRIDVLTVASGDALKNLVELAGDEKETLLRLPVFVPARRVSKLAQQLGFADTANIHIANESTDEGLVNAVVQWHQPEEVSGETAE